MPVEAADGFQFGLLVFGEQIVPGRAGAVGAFPGNPGDDIDRGIGIPARDLAAQRRGHGMGGIGPVQAFRIVRPGHGIERLHPCLARLRAARIKIIEPGSIGDPDPGLSETFVNADRIAVVHAAAPCAAFDGVAGTGTVQRGFCICSKGKNTVILQKDHAFRGNLAADGGMADFPGADCAGRTAGQLSGRGHVRSPFPRFTA